MRPMLLLLTLLTATALAQPQAPITDPRDKKTYKTVKIGKQVWMAENLNYNANSSKCYGEDGVYNNLTSSEIQANCNTYGRLYDWATAKTVCPKGWHLPSNAEWNVLYKFVDSSYVVENQSSKEAGKYLKAKNGWNDYEGKSGNGTDKFGFAALPGGHCFSSDGYFSNVGNGGYWWSATEYNANGAYDRHIDHSLEYAYRYKDTDKADLQSVRCVQD